jgi:hypothetical protein
MEFEHVETNKYRSIKVSSKNQNKKGTDPWKKGPKAKTFFKR